MGAPSRPRGGGPHPQREPDAGFGVPRTRLANAPSPLSAAPRGSVALSPQNCVLRAVAAEEGG